MQKFHTLCLVSLFLSITVWGQQAQLSLPAYFSDQMVLQRDTTVIVGNCLPNISVDIAIGSHHSSVQSDHLGKWKAIFYGIKAGGPYEVKIVANAEKKVFKDVLIGDVWLASGQSNMQWRLSAGVEGWGAEKKNATIENIRLLHVDVNPAGKPVSDLEGHQWKKCNPENLESFSAVAYFFSKYTHQHQGIPIGIIHSSQGGSRIETWMSAKALEQSGVAHDPIWSYEDFVKVQKQYDLDWAYREEIFEKVNVGERLGVHQPEFDDAHWKQVYCPQNWKENELKGSGYVWMRKQIFIEDKKTLGDTCRIYFGRIIHGQQAYLNGKKLNTLGSYQGRDFHFLIPTSDLIEGKNVLAVRLIRYWGEAGGFIEEESNFGIFSQQDSIMRIPLNGYWKYHNKIEPVYPEMPILHQKPTLLYNGMIAPLAPLQVKGFLWYQGESNANRNADSYDDLLQAMISDWRKRFEIPNAPFLVVQLPNYYEYETQPSDNNWPRLRESQANVAKLPGVELAIIIDLGNPKDVHPRNKKEVGYRLAQLARKTVYDEDILHTGPTLKSIQFKGNKAILLFEHVGEGLVSKDGEPLREFALASEDGQFYWAQAKIKGKNKIIVTTDQLKTPIALRYAWQNNPKVNLYNSADLPAAPFRTDEWEQESSKK